MDLATILDALVGLLVAGSLGFLAYGGWLCMRHANKLDDPARHAPDAKPAADGERDPHRPILLD